jgi:TRAP-type C4-dicarboxylate transport system substrate-binding protein
MLSKPTAKGVLLLLVSLLVVWALPADVGAQGTSVLKFAAIDKQDSLTGGAIDWYLKRVEELSKGRVKFEKYWADSLVPQREILHGLDSGVIDVGYLTPAMYPSRLPLVNVNNLPTTHSSSYAFFMAMRDLIEQVPAVQDELTRAGVRYLTNSSFPAYYPLTRKPLTSVDGFKGLKIRALGVQLDMVKALGAAAVALPTPQVYDALDKGTIDGAIYPPPIIADFGFYGAAKNLWKLPIAANVSVIVIGIKSWNKLPADLQNIMVQAEKEHQTAYHRILELEGMEKAYAKMKAEGLVVREASEEAKAALRAPGEQIWTSWIQEMEGKGLPGRKVADTFRSLLDKYEPLTPKK